jgi:hypothetical protein
MLISDDLKKWVELCFSKRDEEGLIGEVGFEPDQTVIVRTGSTHRIVRCPSLLCTKTTVIRPYVKRIYADGSAAGTTYITLSLVRSIGPNMIQSWGVTSIGVCPHVYDELEEYVAEVNKGRHNEPNTEAEELLMRTYKLLLRDYLTQSEAIPTGFTNDVISIIISYLPSIIHTLAPKPSGGPIVIE